MMFDFLSRSKKLNNAAHQLFLNVIEQSRNDKFYKNYGVEDSLDGRFDLMTMHMSIILNKLEQHSEINDAKIVRRNLQEIMFDNLDLSLREIGVGDLGVGKKIKVMAEAFYGRIAVYQSLLNSNNQGELSDALERNLYRGKDLDDKILPEMVKYVFSQWDNVHEQSIEKIVKGNIIFLAIEGEI